MPFSQEMGSSTGTQVPVQLLGGQSHGTPAGHAQAVHASILQVKPSLQSLSAAQSPPVGFGSQVPAGIAHGMQGVPPLHGGQSTAPGWQYSSVPQSASLQHSLDFSWHVPVGGGHQKQAAPGGQPGHQSSITQVWPHPQSSSDWHFAGGGCSAWQMPEQSGTGHVAPGGQSIIGHGGIRHTSPFWQSALEVQPPELGSTHSP